MIDLHTITTQATKQQASLSLRGWPVNTEICTSIGSLTGNGPTHVVTWFNATGVYTPSLLPEQLNRTPVFSWKEAITNRRYRFLTTILLSNEFEGNLFTGKEYTKPFTFPNYKEAILWLEEILKVRFYRAAIRRLNVEPLGNGLYIELVFSAPSGDESESLYDINDDGVDDRITEPI